MKLKAEIYPDKGGKYRWRLRRGRRITAVSGESFASKGNAKRAWRAMENSLQQMDAWVVVPLKEVSK